MKKLKLGKLEIKALTERQLKNVLGGVDSPSSTVTTRSSFGTTISKGVEDADDENGDTDEPSGGF